MEDGRKTEEDGDILTHHSKDLTRQNTTNMYRNQRPRKVDYKSIIR